MWVIAKLTCVKLIPIRSFINVRMAPHALSGAGAGTKTLTRIRRKTSEGIGSQASSRMKSAELRASGMIIYRILGERQFLLLQASDGVHHWTPPKGHVNAGEDLFQTAVRETLEESGLHPASYEVHSELPPLFLEYVARGKKKRVDYWLAKLKDPNASIKLSHEHQDFKWVTAAEAKCLTYEKMGDAILKCEQYLQTLKF